MKSLHERLCRRGRSLSQLDSRELRSHRASAYSKRPGISILLRLFGSSERRGLLGLSAFNSSGFPTPLSLRRRDCSARITLVNILAMC